MFLAPTRNVQEYEMAEVEARLLDAQAGREPAQGPGQQEKAAEAGMASARCVGVPVELGEPCGADMRVSAGRMRAVELFTGAGTSISARSKGKSIYSPAVPMLAVLHWRTA